MAKEYSKKRPKINKEETTIEQTAQEGGNEMNAPVNCTCTFAKLQQSGSNLTPEKADKIFAKICTACDCKGSPTCLTEGRLALGDYFDKFELDLITNDIPATAESNTVANVVGSVKDGTVFVAENAYSTAKTIVKATALGAICTGELVYKGAAMTGKGIAKGVKSILKFTGTHGDCACKNGRKAFKWIASLASPKPNHTPPLNADVEGAE